MVGGAGACLPSCKTETFFLIPLALTMPIINNFQQMELRGNSQTLTITMKVIFNVSNTPCQIPRKSQFYGYTDNNKSLWAY